MKNHKRPARNDGRSVETSLSQLDTAIRLADAGDCEHALRVLAKGNLSAPDVINARAVCLMRLGRTADAVRVFRSLVLPAGCTWMKRDLPVIYRTNFSTALLLAGLTVGARDTLWEITERAHPSVVRLQEAFVRWEANLSWWQRFCWKFGLAPEVPLTIHFVPGEFVDPLNTNSTTPTSPGPPMPNVTVQQVA